MYQNPVGDLEKVRRSRKRVKSILSDIGLQSCSELSEELKSFDAGDECFNNTEWDDLADSYSGKRRKKWCYRTQTFCCNLCWFSTRSSYTFRGHVQRCHEEELDLASLSMCKSCPFIGHPSVTDQHVKMFHSTAKVPASASQATVQDVNNPSANVDRYLCRSCGYQDSLIYVMKKHILVNHCAALLKRYVGHQSQSEKKGDGKSNYYCKMCSMPAQTCEHLLFHILSSEKHKELEAHLKPLLGLNSRYVTIKKRRLSLPPKAVQKTMVRKSPVTPLAKTPTSSPVPTVTSSGTMLLAAQSNTTALLCTPGVPPRQVYIPSQASAKNLLLSNTPVTTLQNPSQAPARLPAQTVVKTGFSMFVPSLAPTQPRQIPITVRVPALPQTQPRQVLLPPGVHINVPGKMGLRPPQPLLVTPNLTVNHQPAPQPPILASQSIRLIPTGNNVNGVPTYTLAPVQVTVPIRARGGGGGGGAAAQVVGKGPVVLTQNNVTTVQQLKTPVAPMAPGATGMHTQQRPAVFRKKNELVVLSPFLKMDNKTVKCLKCKILLTEKGIFHHLLHGLKCVFCPLMFYSLKQITEHVNTQHSLSVKANRDLLKNDFEIDTNERGDIAFTSFDLNTNVPKEQLGDKELSLLVVTGGLEKIFLKMYPEPSKVVGTASAKHIYTGCPLCQVKMGSKEDYDSHLKSMHHIMPTIHAILKTPAFKCIYCLGVYTERFTPKTVSIHVQRCRCAPKPVKDAERLKHPDPHSLMHNGEETQPRAGENKFNGASTYTFASVNVEVPGQADAAQPFSKRPAVAIMSNTATARGGKMAKMGKSKGVGKSGRGSSSSRDQANSSTKDWVAPVDLKSRQVRKKMLNTYFNQKPYMSEVELETLAARLWLKRPDVVAAFGETQKMCMEAISSKKTAVLLGFNMTEMKKVKHDIVIPGVLPGSNSAETAVQTEVFAIKSESVDG
ncbi:hypothetical protein ACEWY4_019969 [Coilia grayii]|uniref:C2H2-type domain-containing protein n=1 Tax=Coilia grayii TaxID=363190 RepID=A0ABD1JCJ0_9TELE